MNVNKLKCHARVPLSDKTNVLVMKSAKSNGKNTVKATRRTENKPTSTRLRDVDHRSHTNNNSKIITAPFKNTRAAAVAPLGQHVSHKDLISHILKSTIVPPNLGEDNIESHKLAVTNALESTDNFVPVPSRISRTRSKSTSRLTESQTLKCLNTIGRRLNNIDKDICCGSQANNSKKKNLSSANLLTSKTVCNSTDKILNIVLTDIQSVNGSRRSCKNKLAGKEGEFNNQADLMNTSGINFFKSLRVVLQDIQPNNNILQQRSRSNESVHKIEDNIKVTSGRNKEHAKANETFVAKDLVVIVRRLENEYIHKIEDNVELTTGRNEERVKADEIFAPKSLVIRLRRLENQNDIAVKPKSNLKKIDHKHKKAPQKVTFESNTKSINAIHNLRKLPHKNYLDESLLNSPTTDEQEGKCPFTDMKKKDAFPIYKKTVSDATEHKTRGEDVYEFIDVSPKAHKPRKRCRQHNSSIEFDKDTYEILKKLEQKEAKAIRKVARQKKKLACNKTSYNKIVDEIVSNVMQKVLKRKNVSLTKVDTSQPVEQNTNVLNNSNQDSINRQAPQKVHVNNFQEVNVTGHNPSDVSIENPIVTDQSDTNNSTKQKDHVTVTRKKPVVTNDAQSDNDDINDDNMFNDSDIESATNFLSSIGSFDNSVPQRDIDTCFGFDDMPSAPCTRSAPARINEKGPINIMCNVVLRRGRGDVNSVSSVDFGSRRPNANSTMIHKGAASKTSSPWRVNCVNDTYTPYFFSTKDKALPRMDQEMVINHTMVEHFEAACSKTPRKEHEIPVKKPAKQQSILDFVNSNIEKQNEILPHSLYDYEAFNSPKKKTREKTFTTRLQNVSRNILDGSNIASSTPVQRTPLADISNSSEGTGENSGENNAENVTYFGFDENSRISPVKQKRNNKNSSKENDGDNKPSRFDINKLRSYSKKSKRADKSKPINVVKEATSISASEEQDTSVSIFEASNEETVGDICLFEEPEEMLDKMSPVHVDEKKPRRRRYNSCVSDTSDFETKKKRHKKTKLEVEQEAWIKDFNKMCTEIDEYELELE